MDNLDNYLNERCVFYTAEQSSLNFLCDFSLIVQIFIKLSDQRVNLCLTSRSRSGGKQYQVINRLVQIVMYGPNFPTSKNLKSHSLKLTFLSG